MNLSVTKHLFRQGITRPLVFGKFSYHPEMQRGALSGTVLLVLLEHLLVYVNTFGRDGGHSP